MSACQECGESTSNRESHCRRCRLVLALGAASEPCEDFPAVPGYELLAKLGEGGFAPVYLAERRADRKQVALKVFPPGRASASRAEVDALARVRSAACAGLVEDGLDADPPYLAMTFVDGTTFRAWRAAGPADLRAAVAAVGRAAEELHRAAHAVGVCHLDLTPNNLLLDERARPGLVDFGSSRPPGWIADDRIPGTRGYMAPELRGGLAGVPADVFALGGLLAFAATGRDPGEPRTPDGVPRGLRTIIDRCRRETPGERYPSGQHVGDAVARWLGGYPEPDAGFWHRGRCWFHRNRLAVILATAALAAVLVLAVGAFAGRVRAAAETRAAETARFTARADAAFARGRWADAEAGYAEAVARGSPERPRLEVARLRCALRLNRHAGSEAALDACLADPTLAERRADILLLQGEWRLCDLTTVAAGRNLVRQALACEPPLEPADAAYAEGLVADRPAAGLAAFRAALALDPAHHAAHAGTVTALALFGRRADAAREADVMRRTFPGDPLPDVVDVFCRLSEGDEVGARRAWQSAMGKRPPAERGPTDADFDAVAEVFAFSRAMNRTPGPLGFAQLAEQVKLVARVERIKRRSDAATALGIPSPGVAWWFEMVALYCEAAAQVDRFTAAVRRGDMKAAAASREAGFAAVRRALDRFPTAEILYVAGGMHFIAALEHQFAGRFPEMLRELQTAYAYAGRAADAPVTFPGGVFDYQAHAFAMYIDALLLSEDGKAFPPDPDRERRLGGHLAALVGPSAPSAALRKESMDQFLTFSVPVPMKRRAVALWAVLSPQDPQAWRTLAELEWSAGATAAAFDAADHWGRAGGDDYADAVRGWRAAKARQLTVKHYPAVAAAAGPAAAYALPGVRTELRERYGR